MKYRPKNNRAFTVLELLVVMGLIGIFITLVTVVVSRTRGAEDDTNRASLVRSITGTLEVYRSRYGKYPATLDNANLNEIESYSSQQKALVTYIAFDLDGNTATCEAYSVSTMMDNPDGREMQHDDDRVIRFSGNLGTCTTVVDSSVSATCTQGSTGCMFGKEFIKTGDTSLIAQDWVFDLSNLPFN